MGVEAEVGRVIVEALRREGGEATADRLIYAYIRLRGRFKYGIAGMVMVRGS